MGRQSGGGPGDGAAGDGDGPEVKGAHDAEFVIVDGKAYILGMANDVQPSENPEWPFIYCTCRWFRCRR